MQPELSKRVFLATMLVLLSMMLACTRPSGISENAAGDQALPFHETSDAANPSAGRTPDAGKLPAGLPIAIRLKTPVSSESARSGDGFEGVLDEPLLIDGHIAIAQGATAWGHVLSAKASHNLKDPGYLRIALVSIASAGKPLVLQTSSIFLKGGARKRNLAMIGGGTGTGSLVSGSGNAQGKLIGASSANARSAQTTHASGTRNVWLGTGQRLIFRLAQPADLHPTK